MLESTIILFIVFNLLISVYLQIRNILALYKDKSEISKKISTEEEYKQMQNYNRDKLFFGILKSIISALKDILTIKLRLNQKLFDKFFRDTYMSEVVFFLATYNINSILETPFDMFSTFFIEHVHGFNKMTLGLFITDLIKKTMIINIIFFLLLNVVLKLVSNYLSSFWLYLWTFLSVFQIAMVVIYPVFIQPFFNKFTELADGSLKDKIKALSGKIGFKASKIFVMDGSKRSGHSNAYFVGLTKEKRIVLYDTLIDQLDEDEIIAVLCHEFGHWCNSHTLKLACNILIQQLFLFWFTNQLLNNEYFTKMLFYQDEPLIIKLMYASYFLNIMEYPVTLFNNIITRIFERESDLFAVQQGYGKDLSSALVKLSKENKGNLSPDYLYSTFNHSHPTLVERMQLVEDEMKKLE
jgi:STE24 endopeptidase